MSIQSEVIDKVVPTVLTIDFYVLSYLTLIYNETQIRPCHLWGTTWTTKSLSWYQENEHLEEKVLSLSDLVTQLKESNAELKFQVENVQSKPIENLEEDSENKIKYSF